MADVTLFHNPRCSTSVAALDVATRSRVEFDVVQYLKTPLDAVGVRSLLDKLEDAPTELVRRDPNFARLGLTDADVQTVDQVVDVLSRHPELMQRPVLVRGDRAIIGRPKSRVPEFLA